MDKDTVSTFMEVTSCESQAYAVQHLGSCRWNLEEAINLYFNAGGPSAGAPAPISDGAVEVQMEEDEYDDGVGGYNGFGGGDARAPIPARVEASYDEDDACYADRSTAHEDEAPSIMDEAPYPVPVPAVPVQALSEIEATGWGEAEIGEIEATGWGEAEPGDGGVVGGENVDGGGGQAHDVDEDDDSRNSEEGSNEEDNEQYDNMSYTYSDNEDQDEDDDYYASIADDDGSHGPEEDGEQPRPAPPQQAASSLDDLYRPPLGLMFNGHFHAAKVRAAREDRLLLVNLQTGNFQSELHNRDLWSDDQVKGVVKSSFVFFLRRKSDDYMDMDECAKVSTFYRLDDEELPAVLVLDPITGQLLDKRSGPMTPDEFVKYTDEYTKLKPSALSKPKFVKKTSASAEQGSDASEEAAAAAAAVEKEPAAPEISAPAAEAGEQEQEVPENSAPATEEQEQQVPENSAPASGEEDPVAVAETESPDEMVEDDDELMEGEKMYKLRIRFPDGTMVPKEFGCKRRVASLFAFCRSAVSGGGQRAFRIMRFAGGAFEAVQGNGGATFEDLGLNYAAVSIVFDT